MQVNKPTPYYEVLDGDCLRYLNDGSISDVALTFVGSPFRQGKDYRFFDDRVKLSRQVTTAIIKKRFSSPPGIKPILEDDNNEYSLG